MDSEWLDRGLLGRVRRIARPWTAHLVGGAVRDHLLGRRAHDLDLVTTAGEGLSAALAHELPARLVPIGGDRFAATRLVGDGFVIDLWDRGAMTLDAELARRDLTINAMAVDLANGSWHDPHGGRADLDARLLRATTEASFVEDPLRILRLARLAAELPSFSVEPHTLELAEASLVGLPQVAAERRREEFGRALRAGRPERALGVWSAVSFYPAFVGSQDGAAAKRALAAFERAALRCRELTELAAATAFEPPPRVDAFILHAGLLLAAAPAGVERLLTDGYCSRREARSLALVLEQRSVPQATSDRRWFLHRAADVWPTALVLAAALGEEAEAGQGAALADCLRLAQTHGEAIFDPPPLMRGDEIRELLDLSPGPEVGVAARRLRRRQIEGHLEDRDQAAAWLVNARRSSNAD